MSLLVGPAIHPLNEQLDKAADPDAEIEREPHWYCVRAKPKAEHLAAAHLRQLEEITVFCPRIRYQKATKRGKVRFVEALFPGYLFAKFDMRLQMRAVQSQPSVSGLLHFGDYYPRISAQQIAEMRSEFDDDEVREIEAKLEEGDEVEIVGGALKGLTVMISRLLPGKERVRILMEWLGEEREAEVSIDAIARKGNIRRGPMT